MHTQNLGHAHRKLIDSVAIAMCVCLCTRPLSNVMYVSYARHRWFVADMEEAGIYTDGK